MGKRTSIRNLQIMAALDSLSFGLLYQTVGRHIHTLGGPHLAEGIFAVGVFFGELSSGEITKRIVLSLGKTMGLLLVLCMALLTHLLTVFAQSVEFLILMRILFSAFNQTKTLSYGLLFENENNVNVRDRLEANYRILYGSGYILGPIISGYLLQAGFCYVAGLAAFLTLLNVILLMYVDAGQDCRCVTKSGGKLEETWKNYLKDLQASILGTNWDVFVQEYLFSCGVLIFFSKLRYVLLTNYGIGSIILGYTEAYVNGLELASMCYISEPLTQALRIYPSTFVSEILLFLLTVFSALACFAPNYKVFMLLLIPLVVLKSTILSMWEESLGGVAAGLTAPLVFGILANQTDLAHLVVVILTCIPLMLCLIIIRMCSKAQNELGSEETVNDNSCLYFY